MTSDSPAKPKSDLPVRLASAIVMVAVAAVALWFGGLPFLILLGAAGAVLLHEWLGVARGMAVSNGLRNLVMLAAPIATFAAVFGLWLIREQLGFAAALWVIAMVVATDVGAYFAGRAFGGARLAPSISPSKTWSGLFGGVAAALVVGASLGDRAGIVGVPLWIGAAMGLLAQLGDLGQSWMKRRAGVKDSGKLIPGHGGVFDRVDGLLPVAILLGILAFTGHLAVRF